MADGNHLTTNCVWCGVEFNLEAMDTEIQPDSVGFVCPTCNSSCISEHHSLSTVKQFDMVDSHRRERERDGLVLYSSTPA